MLNIFPNFYVKTSQQTINATNDSCASRENQCPYQQANGSCSYEYLTYSVAMSLEMPCVPPTQPCNKPYGLVGYFLIKRNKKH